MSGRNSPGEDKSKITEGTIEPNVPKTVEKGVGPAGIQAVKPAVTNQSVGGAEAPKPIEGDEQVEPTENNKLPVKDPAQ